MLKVFRDNLKQLSWVLWVVIAVFVILAFEGIQLGGSDRANLAATVGDREATLADFERQYRTLQQRNRAIYGDAYTPELEKRLQLPRQALTTLVQRQILLLEAERLGLEATRDEVNETVHTDSFFQDERGRFVGRQEYLRLIRSRFRTTPEAFESQIADDLLLTKFLAVMRETIFVSDYDVERRAREQAERASLRFLSLPASRIAGDVPIDAGELEAFFSEHLGDYRFPERRSVGYLSLNINTIRGELEIPEADIRAYYNDNADEFRQEEQVRARHILLFVGDDRSEAEARSQLEAARRRIEAGEDFGQIAAEISEDVGTKDRGGDLGFFRRQQQTPAIEAAAFGAEVGEIVGPIENTLGTRRTYHLIEVTNRREGGVQDFEQVKNQIRVGLLGQRSQEEAEARAQALFERLASETPGDDDALRSLAEAEGITYEVTELLAQDDNVPTIGRQTAFSDRAFALAEDTFSEPVRIPAGWAILVLREVQPPRDPELNEVEDAVRRALIAEKQEGLARERLAAIREEIAAGDTDLETAASELGGQLQEAPAFDRLGQIAGLGRQPAIIDKALELSEGEVAGPFSTPLGLVLFEVTERQHFDPVAFQDEKESLRERLTDERHTALLETLIQERIVELEPWINPLVREQFEIEDPFADVLL